MSARRAGKHKQNGTKGPLDSIIWVFMIVMIACFFGLVGWAWATHPYLFPAPFPFNK